MTRLIRTASFRTYDGPGSISIARRPPRGRSGFRVMRELAPGPWFNSVPPEEFDRRYRAQLAALNPATVVERIFDLAAGETPVLLCWEAPPLHRANSCHRSMLALWIASACDDVEFEEIGHGCDHHDYMKARGW